MVASCLFRTLTPETPLPDTKLIVRVIQRVEVKTPLSAYVCDTQCPVVLVLTRRVVLSAWNAP
eukprot:3937452-Rhodomonas_salina.2